MQELGDVFYRLFGGDDIVPSDFVAGFKLVSEWQKATGQYSEESLLKNTTPLGMGHYISTYHHRLHPNTAIADVPLYHSIQHHMKYCIGSYGWPIMQLTHPVTSLCRMMGMIILIVLLCLYSL